MMGAYFLFSRLETASPEEEKKILGTFALRNMKLYGFWLVVLLPIVLVDKRELYLAPGGWISFFRELLFGSTFAASWYITASVIGVYLIWILTKKLGDKCTAVLVLLAFILLTLWSSYPQVLTQSRILAAGFRLYVNHFDNPIWSFPVSLFWICAGKWFARCSGTGSWGWKQTTALLLSGVALYLEWRLVRTLNGSYNNDSYFMLAPFCLLLFAWLQSKGKLLSAHGVYLRRASTVIYTVHYSLIYILQGKILPGVYLEGEFAVFCLALLGSLLVYGAIEGLLRFGDRVKLLRILRNAY